MSPIALRLQRYTLPFFLSCWLLQANAQAPPGPKCNRSQELVVTADAAPDRDPSQPGAQVERGTRVQLSGTALVIKTEVNCDVTEQLAPLRWSLSFQPLGGAEQDVTSMLTPPSAETEDTPSTTSFVANQEGTYRARVTSGTKIKEALIVSMPQPAALARSCGAVTFLRANDVGGGFGPPTDFIDVEIVTKLSSEPPKAMGFQLRNDGNGPARHGMLDLLREAFTNGYNVCLDYFLVPGRTNGVIIRVELTK